MKEVTQLGNTSKTKKTVSSRDKSSKKSRSITIPYPWLFAFAILYLTVPLFMFFLGYLRLSIGIPLTLIFAGIVLFSVSDCLNNPDGKRLSRSDHDFTIPVSYLVGFAVTALAVTLLSGVSEYATTIQDHAFRRAILKDLIDYDWPVIYNYSTQTNPEVREIFGMASGECSFTYYFIFWMPAALVGKVFGFGAGNFVLFLWSALGIMLCLVTSCAVIKRCTAAVPFCFVFFSGLDLIPNLLHELVNYKGWFWLEGWVDSMSYISNFRELASVFNQMIPCFLIVALIMMSNNTRSFGLTAGILFAYSPWAVFGMLPVVLALMFSSKHRATKISKTLANTFSPVNLASAFLILIVFGSYYMSNSGAVSVRCFTWYYYDNALEFIFSYLAFIAIEVLPFVFILYSKEKKSPVYWAASVTLLLIPFYCISDMNDFCMRGSMPALFFFCILLSGVVAEVMDRENTPVSKKGWLKSAAIMTVVLVMTFPALFNLFLVFGNTVNGIPDDSEEIGSFGNIRTATYAEVIQDQFFAANYEDSFFYRYFAKK